MIFTMLNTCPAPSPHFILTTFEVLFPCFADEETETQRGTVTYSKPHSKYMN